MFSVRDFTKIIIIFPKSYFRMVPLICLMSVNFKSVSFYTILNTKRQIIIYNLFLITIYVRRVTIYRINNDISILISDN